jgi:hypothetical protein
LRGHTRLALAATVNNSCPNNQYPRDDTDNEKDNPGHNPQVDYTIDLVRQAPLGGHPTEHRLLGTACQNERNECQNRRALEAACKSLVHFLPSAFEELIWGKVYAMGISTTAWNTAYELAKTVSTGTGTLRVRVINREALLLDGVFKIDRGAINIGRAHFVYDNFDTVEVADIVIFHQALVKKQLVNQARTATRLHRNPQPQIIAALLLEEVLHLRCGGLSQRDVVSGGKGIGHRVPPYTSVEPFGVFKLSIHAVKYTHPTRYAGPTAKKGPSVSKSETPSPADEPEIGKGRPTPRRRDREAAARRPLVSNDRKEARARLSKERDRARLGLAAGEERYLPVRDKGPQRKWARDYIDSRWSFGEFLIPIMFAVIIATFLPSIQAQFIAIVVLWAFFALTIIDASLAGYQVRKGLRLKFGQDSTENGVRWYSAMRSLQMRGLRLPKAQVKRGEKPR